MYSKNRNKFSAKISAAIAASLTVFMMTPLTAGAVYINTNRDTGLPEEKYNIPTPVVAEEYEKLYETDSAVFYFRDDRDVLAIYDKEAKYLWKTGIDSATSKELKKKAKKAETEEDLIYLEENPAEQNLNEIYTYFANSLVSIEYRDPDAVESLKKSSSGDDDSKSELKKVSDNKYYLDINFKKAKIKMKIYLTFEGKSVHYDLKYDDITGDGKVSLTDLYITPFLGSSGGKQLLYNRSTGEYDIDYTKPAPSGYAFIPDGSGALVRFRDNTMSFQTYSGDIYGRDPSEDEYYYVELTDAMPVKDPVMPVFGVAYGDNQVGFVAYADKGDEYMSVVCTPEENTTYYTWTAPKFTYNLKFYKVYNKAGSGYYAIMDELNNFDISLTYDFLSGDGSGEGYAANYVGMALDYREHLINEGVLSDKKSEVTGDIPIRLDFIMSDAQNSVVGMENIVVTTTQDVRDILNDVYERGIKNINSGLSGWQKKGASFSKPYTQKYSTAIGNKQSFEELFKDFAEKGVDISYDNDYVTINKSMLNYYNTAVKHVNSWYCFEDRKNLLMPTVPVTTFGYATPKKSSEWILKQFGALKDYSQSMTIDGVGSTLTGTYNSDGEKFSATDAVNLYRETLDTVNNEIKINIKTPGEYLWKYTDRYLESPVGHSQYVFETDAVPFLQLVLNSTMEVYAPYANFSFYTQTDILKMIDYNIYPSFILSSEPSYKLMDTVSSDLYSTEYSLYRDLIKDLYVEINSVLSEVSGYSWTDREVLENGVIVNTYDANNTTKKIVINYTEDDYVYENITVPSLKAVVIK